MIKSYNENKNKFISIIEDCGAKVISSSKPFFNYDYGFLVSGMSKVSSELCKKLTSYNVTITTVSLLKETICIYLKCKS